MRGSEHNDRFYNDGIPDPNGYNYSGDTRRHFQWMIFTSAGFQTGSYHYAAAGTVNEAGDAVVIEGKRNDLCVVPRAVPIVGYGGGWSLPTIWIDMATDGKVKWLDWYCSG